jgi:hypothetical protein
MRIFITPARMGFDGVTSQSLKSITPLHRVKEKRSIVLTIKGRTCNWDDHILQRNCLIKHDIEGKIEERIKMTGGRGRRRKETRDKLKKIRGYLELKEEVLDHTLWRTRFGRGYGPLVGQTADG